MRKVKFFSVAALLCAFCLGCSDDDGTSSNNPGSTGNSGSKDCQCDDASCQNCTVTKASCNDNKLTISSETNGIFEGQKHFGKESSSNTCKFGCEQISDSEARCKESSNSSENGSNACQCENSECMNCGTIVKQVCTNGMSIGRIDTTTAINGSYGGGTVQRTTTVGEDCPAKCTQVSATEAVCN